MVLGLPGSVCGTMVPGWLRLGLIFLPVIFLPMLAFGQATYIGNQTTPGKLF